MMRALTKGRNDTENVFKRENGESRPMHFARMVDSNFDVDLGRRTAISADLCG